MSLHSNALRMAFRLGAAAASLSLAACAIAPREDGTGKVALSEPVHPAQAGLPNFGEVEQGSLYRGGQPRVDRDNGVDGYQILVERYRIRTIVDLTNDPIDHWLRRRRHDCDQLSAAQRASVRYVSLPSFEAFPSENGLADLLRILRDPANRPVFLHCADGENRTGALVAGYRVIEEQWPPDDAIAEMTHFNVFLIWKWFNGGFVDRVEMKRSWYDAQLRSEDPAAPRPLPCPP